MSLFENSPRKWPKTQKLFLSNGKIVYYQDVLQLPVPLNTLHNIHLNAKSHNPFKNLTVESITSSLQCITDTLKAARFKATTMSLF